MILLYVDIVVLNMGQAQTSLLCLATGENYMEFIDYKDRTYYKVKDFLIGSGLGICDDEGERVCGDEEYTVQSCIGILLRTEVPHDHWCSVLLRKKFRKVFLGHIKFNEFYNLPGNKPRKWVFFLYGRKNIQFAKNIIKRIEKKFGVEIVIELKTEKIKVEKV